MPFPSQTGGGPEIANSIQGMATLKISQLPYFLYGGGTSGIDVVDLLFVSAHLHLAKYCLGANDTWLALSNR